MPIKPKKRGKPFMELSALFISDPILIVFFRREIVLTYSTERANPIFWKVLKCCSGLYAVVRIAYFRVIYITASVTNILFHNSNFLN